MIMSSPTGFGLRLRNSPPPGPQGLELTALQLVVNSFEKISFVPESLAAAMRSPEFVSQAIAIGSLSAADARAAVIFPKLPPAVPFQTQAFASFALPAWPTRPP